MTAQMAITKSILEIDKIVMDKIGLLCQTPISDLTPDLTRSHCRDQDTLEGKLVEPWLIHNHGVRYRRNRL